MSSTRKAPGKPPTTEVVKAERSTVTPYDPSLTSGWGGMESGVDAADVLIPKLLIMQPISERVTDREAGAGDIIRSTTNEKLGDMDVGVRFIPLCMNKVWNVFEKVGQKFEFRKSEAFTADNAQAPWNWTEGRTEWQRNQALNLFVLLPNDIIKQRNALRALEESGELPDVGAALLPVVVQFTRTSFKTGKQISTHFMQSQALGMPAAATTLSLVTEFVKGEKGSYYVYALGATQRTTPDELLVAKKWYEIIMKSVPKVHEVHDEPAQPPPPAGDPTY